jgi:hypothetical protein
MSINWSAVNWGSVADWVSGLGSLSAAIVALYLAKWSQSIRLYGYCGLRIAIGGGGPKEELVFISVTNIGTRSTIVSNLGMRVGMFKKRFALIPMVKDQYSDGIPYQIADGQQAKWAVPLDEKKHGFGSYARVLLYRQRTCVLYDSKSILPMAKLSIFARNDLCVRQCLQSFPKNVANPAVKRDAAKARRPLLLR